MHDIERLIAAHAQGRISRAVFLRRLLSLGVSLTFAETLLGSPLRRALAAGPPPLLPARGPRVVLLVFDAFRFDYQHLAAMPNLSRLMRRGATFTNAWVGQLESMTPASHATLSTGATPAHQGIIGFSWRDPGNGEEVYGAWYDEVLAGRLERQLRQHNVNSIPRAVKAADPTARVVALSSEKYYAADAMGGPAADYIFYGLPQGGTIAPQGIPHHTPPDTFLRRKRLSRPWPLRYAEYDALAMDMALAALQAFDPRVLMINLPGCDTYGHKVGGPATPDVMRKLVTGCDQQLGRLLAAYRDRRLIHDTIFVVVGDHGMVPNTQQIVDTTIKQAIREAGGDYLFHTGGSAAFIWLRNPDKAPQVAQHLVDTIPHAPFAHYQTLANGAYVYHPVLPAGRQLDPALADAYQYLMGTFGGPLAPDITLTLTENTVVRNRSDGDLSAPHGNHSGASWGVQHVPLIIAGPGVKQGVELDFPARLMDVAPTVLALLGLEPARMDGVVLADALQQPAAAYQRAYDDMAPKLTAWQRALVAQSAADLHPG